MKKGMLGPRIPIQDKQIDNFIDQELAQMSEKKAKEEDDGVALVNIEL